MLAKVTDRGDEEQQKLVVLGGDYFQSFVCEWEAVRELFSSVNLRRKKKRTQSGTD